MIRMDMVGMVPRETIQVLVHEWVTGGGLAGSPLPASWAAEGRAMRRSIAADFASLPHVRVVVTLDERQPDEPGPWTVVRVGPGEEPDRFASLAARADFTAIIAPESGGVLAERARAVDRAGGRSLGSSPTAIDLTGNKLRLGAHLADRGIATPPCRRVIPALGLPIEFPYPAVLKPIDGAGVAGDLSRPQCRSTPRCSPDHRRGPIAALRPRHADERELSGRRRWPGPADRDRTATS
jgi:predicted ATP-grasp superfamily ATP-dependent carboligase